MVPADSSFLRACRGEPTSQVPVWFMRQAGRSLPEYRELRGTESILDAVRRPELAAEITLQPVRRYGVDAAILFSDIVVPVAALGVGVEIVPGRGPVLAEPFTGEADLGRLRPLEAEADVGYVLETVRMVVAEADVPLIGLAGGPFTVASYLVEGGPTRDFGRTKALMHAAPATFARLLDALAEVSAAFLAAQVAAGASAVQLFDSWAGALSRADYERFVLPASTKVLGALAGAGVPRIHFGVGTGELLDLLATAGADVVGVDWRVPLTTARDRVGPGPVLQGNLDPAVCLAGAGPAEAEARRVLAEGCAAGPGYVFNLGHGVLPATDPVVLEHLVQVVHGFDPAAPEPQAARRGRSVAGSGRGGTRR